MPLSKWAIVTGASSGIGRDLSLKLADAGYSLALVARRLEKLESLKSEIDKKNLHVEVITLALDLSKESSIDTIKAQFEDKNIELLVNNAGYGLNSPFVDTKRDQMTNMIDLNCRALVALTHIFLPGMIARKSGQIVQLASVVSYVAAPYFAVYAASKAFVLSFSKALMVEVEKTGVSILVVCPGPTETEFGEVAQYSAGTPPKALTQSSEQVAKEIMASLALRKNKVLITGYSNKAMVVVTKLLPSYLISKFSAKTLRPQP